jgi:peptidoglycan-associated lipoprotein
MTGRDARIALLVCCTLAGGACAHSGRGDLVARAPSAGSAWKAAPGPTTVADQALARPASTATFSDNRGDDAIYFDFDSATLRDDSKPVLLDVASKLRGRPGSAVRVEGNCDQLGTVEYNLALGEERSTAARDYLIRLGVPMRSIATISYGSQRPRFPGLDEVDRQKNRRDDLVLLHEPGAPREFPHRPQADR